MSSRVVHSGEARDLKKPDFIIDDTYNEFEVGQEELAADIEGFILRMPNWDSDKISIGWQYTEDIDRFSIHPPLVAAQAVLAIVNDFSRRSADMTYSIYCPSTGDLDYDTINAMDNQVDDIPASEQLLYVFSEAMASFIAKQDYSKFI